jgi:hypothetical protein
MKQLCRIAAAVAMLVFLSADAGAQTGASSRISGQVFDASQAAVPSAKVVLENLGTGAKRETVTDGQGRYIFAELPFATYKVTVSAQGFQGQTKTNIALPVATNLNVDFTLATGSISEVIEVKAEAQAVEASAANGLLLGTKQIVDLPINGRDYGRFTLLTPGAVARSNFIADMGFNGMHTIHNNFSIDGVDGSRIDQPYMANGFERGARLLTGSLDTIAEVRVQTSNYRAEYGRSAGSSIAIVSKSGTNEFHGSAFEFLRNDFLDARNFFNTKPTPMPKLRYNNFGGNLGGRIIRDKTFFFANYEGSRQRVGITGTGTVPSQAMRDQVLRTSPELRPLVEQYPLGTSRTANPLVDSYTRTDVSRVREDTGSVRVDHNFSGNDRFYARFNLNDTQTFGPLFGVIPSALGVTDFQLVPVTTTNATVNYSRVWSPSIVMELSAGVQRWGSQINSETPFPQINIQALTVIPGSRRFSRTNSQTNQFGGSMSIVRGAHTIKFGHMYWRSGVNPQNRDLITVIYPTLDDFINNRPNQATVLRGDPGSGRRQNWWGSFIQDTWQVRKGLTVDIGLRWDLGTPNEGEVPRYRVFDVRTNALSAPGAEWYNMNYKNFGPRLGISWQPYSKLVIRTGYGIFFQQFPPGWGYSVAANTIPGNTTLLRSNIPNLRYPVEPFIAAGTAPLPNVEGFNPNKPEIYAQQWNLTLIHELPGNSSIQAAYVGNHGLNLTRQRNINFFDPALGRRPIPNVANVTMLFNDAQSVYHAMQLSYVRRMANGLQGQFNYTWAKVIDNVQDYGLYSMQPQDNRCLGPCDRGLGSGDIRHNVTYQILYQLPFGQGKAFGGGVGGFMGKVISGWELSSLALIRSGIATMVQIPISAFGDNSTANQRPNRVAGQPILNPNKTINSWYNPAAFAQPAAGTFGNAGRNVGKGPDFWQFDASLSKNTNITEGTNLIFRAEVFNLFNRPNFDFANGFFGTPNFGRIFNTFGRTIGFGTSRQIQLSLRLRF